MMLSIHDTSHKLPETNPQNKNSFSDTTFCLESATIIDSILFNKATCQKYLGNISTHYHGNVTKFSIWFANKYLDKSTPKQKFILQSNLLLSMFYTFNLSCNTSNPTYIDFKIVAHRYAQSISIYPQTHHNLYPTHIHSSKARTINNSLSNTYLWNHFL